MGTLLVTSLLALASVLCGVSIHSPAKGKTLAKYVGKFALLILAASLLGVLGSSSTMSAVMTEVRASEGAVADGTGIGHVAAQRIEAAAESVFWLYQYVAFGAFLVFVLCGLAFALARHMGEGGNHHASGKPGDQDSP